MFISICTVVVALGKTLYKEFLGSIDSNKHQICVKQCQIYLSRIRKIGLSEKGPETSSRFKVADAVIRVKKERCKHDKTHYKNSYENYIKISITTRGRCLVLPKICVVYGIVHKERIDY